jgi:hypothetical protein
MSLILRQAPSELLYRYTGLKQPEIGRLPGIDYTGVSVTRKRLVQLLDKDRVCGRRT